MYSRTVLIGRLVADPEIRTTPNGINVATFRIAVDRMGKEKKADFITIVCWRERAECGSRFFRMGKAIGVEGSIQTRDYTDKEGNKRNAFEVVADRLFFVGDKSSGETGNQTRYQPSAAYTPNVAASDNFQVMDDDPSDLPF